MGFLQFFCIQSCINTFISCKPITGTFESKGWSVSKTKLCSCPFQSTQVSTAKNGEERQEHFFKSKYCYTIFDDIIHVESNRVRTMQKDGTSKMNPFWRTYKPIQKLKTKRWPVPTTNDIHWRSWRVDQHHPGSPLLRERNDPTHMPAPARHWGEL